MKERDGDIERGRESEREGRREAAGGAFTYKQKKALEGPVAAPAPASEGASVVLRSRRSGSGGVDLSRRWWRWISCTCGYLVLRERGPSGSLCEKKHKKNSG